ncbi:hypothetical protein MU582_06710 [Nocardioidaceae bacterium SCSIO 66511]|nr:hypothetical protein MU582_06710 [Nocardioidaceae bacterium SCSIO 66511]
MDEDELRRRLQAQEICEPAFTVRDCIASGKTQQRRRVILATLCLTSSLLLAAAVRMLLG